MSGKGEMMTPIGLGKLVPLSEQVVVDCSRYPIVIYYVPADEYRPFHVVDRRNDKTLAVCPSLQDARDTCDG